MLKLFGAEHPEKRTATFDHSGAPYYNYFSPDGCNLRVMRETGIQFIDAISGEIARKPYGVEYFHQRFDALFNERGDQLSQSTNVIRLISS